MQALDGIGEVRSWNVAWYYNDWRRRFRGRPGREWKTIWRLVQSLNPVHDGKFSTFTLLVSCTIRPTT